MTLRVPKIIPMIVLLISTPVDMNAASRNATLQDDKTPWAFMRPDPDLPMLEAPARPNRQLEALGLQAGVWGNLTEGREAWAYPFKLFDGLNFRASVDGRDSENWGATHAVRQTATPCLAIMHYQGTNGSMQESWFVPRKLPALVLLIEKQGTISDSFGLRFRPSLSPMFLEAAGPLKIDWRRDKNLLTFSETNRHLQLAISLPNHSTVQFLKDGWVEIGLAKCFEDPVHPVACLFAATWPGGPSISETFNTLQRHSKDLFNEALEHYRSLLARAPLVRSPDEILNQGIAWSVISLDQLRIENPFLGYGLVSGFGPSHGGTRPRYGWFFEEPTLASWAYHRAGLSRHIRESLKFLQRYQRSDGKTVHEVSQSLPYQTNFFQTYPYAYMHSDGPVYFLAAYGHYFRSTGDFQFIEEEWPRILKTVDWCFSMMDPQDGLMRISEGDWGSAESSTRVWKDTQLEAMWVRALQDTAMLARAMKNDSLALRCESIRTKALASIEDTLWNEKKGVYDWGLNRANESLASLVPHHAIGFWLSSLNQHRVRRNLERMAQADFRTDWGVRSLATKDPNYSEQNYQSGSVWPVWNAGVLISDFKHGRAEDAFRNLQAMTRLRTKLTLGPMPEVLSGRKYELLPEAVPHQMFSELAVMSGFFEGMLGFDLDVPNQLITLSPWLPADWPQLEVLRVPIGKGHLDLRIKNGEEQLEMEFNLQTDAPYSLLLKANLPAGAFVHSAQYQGEDRPYQMNQQKWGTQVATTLPLPIGRSQFRVNHSGGIQWLAQDSTRTEHSVSEDLRIVRWQLAGDVSQIDLEGLAGKSYKIDCRTTRKLRRAEGCRLLKTHGTQSQFEIVFPLLPKNRPGEYAKKSIKLIWFL